MDCLDADGNDFCDNWQTDWPVRNEFNMTRFFWDILDFSHDFGMDYTAYSMASFAAILYGMPCVSGSGYGLDGTCNEPNRASATHCDPPNDLTGIWPPGAMTGSRDSFNAKDFDDLFADDLQAERSINCVYHGLAD